MEIIHLILGKANPERMNGVNKVVSQLATHQQRQGRDVAVWGITNDLSRNFEERVFETLLFPASKNPFGVHSLLRNAIRNKAGSNVVFHLHGGWIPVYTTLSGLFQKLHIRFVITGHGAYNTIAMNRSKWLKKAYFRLFEKTLLKRACKIHSIGQSEVEGLSLIYQNDKNVLLPYGFQLQKAAFPVIPNPDSFTIGFVGRLTSWTKGLDLLIHAFQEFHKMEPQSTLWIVGDGPDRSDLENLITKNKVRNVVFYGSKFGSEKDELISQMHVFAHPSRNEGLPASVLEAAGLGIPVIVSKATNVAQSVSRYKAGTALVNNSAEDLTKAFTEFRNADRDTMKQISKNAARMVSEEFGWDRLIDKFDEMYH
ncbi:MAG: glycosyltransferase family 1 protein [Balneolaceae bacterium]|nr:MAG: glycosyltransferase family 1 protein [Balneolaceae bacterium]